MLRKEKPYSAGGRLKKKRLITRIGSRVPVPKRMGEFGSSVHRSGGSICSGVRRGVAQSGQRICFGYRGP